MAVTGRVITLRHGAQNGSGLGSCFVNGESAVAPNRDEPASGGSASAARPISNHESFGAADFDAKTEARKVKVPEVIPFISRLSRVSDPLRDQDAA